MQHSDAAIEIALNYEKAAEETFRRLYYLRQAEAEALFPPLSSNGSEASSSSGERRAQPLARFHPHPHSGPYPHHHNHHHRPTQPQLSSEPHSQSAEQAQEVSMYADDEYVDYSDGEFSDEYDDADDAMDQDEPERAPPKQEDMMDDEDEANPTPPEELEEVFCTRMVRIQSWRHKNSPLSAERASAEELSLVKDLKRKSSPEPSSDTGRSVTKRARSACGVAGGYNCTACGSSFSTKFTLRRHGKGVRTSPACRAAVSYQFE